MMSSTLADSASRSPSRLSDNPSKKRLCLQANADTIASTYTYAGFSALYDPGREPGPITPVACWAHARRKLHDVLVADHRSAARKGLGLIA